MERRRKNGPTKYTKDTETWDAPINPQGAYNISDKALYNSLKQSDPLSPVLEIKTTKRGDGQHVQLNDSSVGVSSPTSVVESVQPTLLENESMPGLNQRLRAGRGRGIRPRKEPVEPKRQPNDMQKENLIINSVQRLQLDDETAGKFQDDEVMDEYEKIPSDIFSKFAPQAPLTDFENCAVQITHVYGPHILHVIPKKVLKAKYDDLLDDVNDVCKDEPSLVEVPEIGTLVCAPFEGVMFRGYVKRKFENLEVLVQLLDLGVERVLVIKELKPFSSELLGIPLFGYAVKVQGVADKLDYLSPRDFTDVAVPWLKTQSLKIQKIVISDGQLYTASIVGTNYGLAEKIMDFQIWEWESLFKSGLTDDEKLYNAKSWNIESNQLIPASDFGRQPVMMKCTHKVVTETDVVISFTNFHVYKLQKEYRVLQLQIKRYVEQVEVKPHFPILDEMFLFRPVCEMQNQKGSYWRRAIRMDLNVVYCIDTGELYSLRNQETRRMCPDLLRTPAFNIPCAFSGVSNSDLLREAVKHIFVEGKMYPISVISSNNKVYNIDSEAVNAFLKNHREV